MAGVLLMPWQTGFGQALLLTAAIVHAGLGLASLASRHSLAMSRTDWVQLLLGLATPPLLVNYLAAGGKIGGFSAPGGSATKIRMLALEGVHVGPAPLAQQSFGF